MKTIEKLKQDNIPFAVCVNGNIITSANDCKDYFIIPSDSTTELKEITKVTTESLIQRPGESNVTGVQETHDATGAESTQTVESELTTSLMQSADTSSQSNTDWEKRYKDLQSFQSKRENELRVQIKDLEATDSSFQAPTTPDQMEAFKDEHPEVYNMMITLAHQKATEATQGINTQLQSFEEERKMTEFASAQARIQKAHPDFATIINDAVFHTWAEAQPQQVQQWIYNNPDDPDLAIIALDRYKASRDAQTAHPEKDDTNTTSSATTDTSAAQAVSTSSQPSMSEGPKVWTKSEINSLSSADWQANEKDIEKAYLEGRVNFNS